MNNALEAAQLSKRFMLHGSEFKRLLSYMGLGNRSGRELWAVRDVDLTVQKGESIGIIGRNGSGKSTLLQLICGTLQPTSGTVRLSGRVASLLELGAGFDPELTGRENVITYGAIMGLSEQEIRQRFDRILAFSEVAPFIDQAVKTYSSGMFVRLAFATAIHVDPEILVVDEALAVGDEMFQRRCYRKFEQLRQQGITILFVSHSLSIVKMLCDRAVLLEQGRVVTTGNPNDVVNEYTRVLAETERGAAAAQESETEFRYGDGGGEILEVALFNAAGLPSTHILHGESIAIKVQVRYRRHSTESVVAVSIKTLQGFEIWGTNTLFKGIDLGSRSPGDQFTVTFTMPMWLHGGSYVISAGFVEFKADSFLVMDRRYDSLLFRVLHGEKGAGIVNLPCTVVVAEC